MRQQFIEFIFCASKGLSQMDSSNPNRQKKEDSLESVAGNHRKAYLSECLQAHCSFRE
jgi:hypothetical protein